MGVRIGRMLLGIGIGLLWLVQGMAARAEPATPADWRAATERDLAAARELLRDNHPAGHPALGQQDFLDWLDRGHAEGMARAGTVVDQAGYLAVLRAYALGFGDGHIGVKPLRDGRQVRWPGFVVGLRGERWLVVDRAGEKAGLPALGSELLSCDGRPVGDLARERLGRFVANWQVPAERLASAPDLLLDDGNPFLPRLRSCVIRDTAGARDVALDWQPVNRVELAVRRAKAVPASTPGIGLRRVGDGWWIAAQSFQADLTPLLREVERNLDVIRSAPFVVVDLRGNSGGNAAWGARLAEMLHGREYVQARLPVPVGTCGARWRASPANVESLRARPAKQAGIDGRQRERLEALGRELEEALGRGEAFFPALSPACAPPVAAGTALSSAARGRVVLATDHACFSACLIAAQMFLRLGADQVGGATRKGNSFVEAEVAPLPSGLALFGYQMAYHPLLAEGRGPFEPRFPFPGDISDTAALERWVQTLVAP